MEVVLEMQWTPKTTCRHKGICTTWYNTKLVNFCKHTPYSLSNRLATNKYLTYTQCVEQTSQFVVLTTWGSGPARWWTYNSLSRRPCPPGSNWSCLSSICARILSRSSACGTSFPRTGVLPSAKRWPQAISATFRANEEKTHGDKKPPSSQLASVYNL